MLMKMISCPCFKGMFDSLYDADKLYNFFCIKWKFRANGGENWRQYYCGSDEKHSFFLFNFRFYDSRKTDDESSRGENYIEKVNTHFDFLEIKLVRPTRRNKLLDYQNIYEDHFSCT